MADFVFLEAGGVPAAQEGTVEATTTTIVPPAEGSNPFGEEPVAQENGGATDADAIFAAPAAVLVDEDISGSAFFTDYTPAVVPQPAAPAPSAEPADNDPRVLWGRKNADVQKKKDTEEAELKKKQQAKAKEFLAHYFDSRKTLVANRKTSNRTAESAVKLEEVPRTGTAWEKVNVLVSSQAGVHHTKDVGRFKALLQTIKARDVPITA